MRIIGTSSIPAALALAAALSAFAGMQEMKDPRGAFTVTLPAEWKPEVRDGRIEGGLADASLFASSRPRQQKSLAAMADQAAAESSAIARDLNGSWREESRTPLKVSGIDGLRVRAVRDNGMGSDIDDSYFVLTRDHEIDIQFVAPRDEFGAIEKASRAIIASVAIPAGQIPPPPEPEPRPALPPRPLPPPELPETRQPFPPISKSPAPAQPLPFPDPLPTPAPSAQGILREASDTEGILRFTVPADWRVQQQSWSVAAFDAARPATAAARVGPRQAANLDELARASIASWQQQVPQWQEISRQAISLAGRPALIIRASGAPGGTPVVSDHVLVLTEAWQAGLTVWCAQADFAQRRVLFQRIIQSFQVR